jgi:hypothetical protein
VFCCTPDTTFDTPLHSIVLPSLISDILLSASLISRYYLKLCNNSDTKMQSLNLRTLNNSKDRLYQLQIFERNAAFVFELLEVGWG